MPIERLKMADLGAALAAGVADFRRAPLYGLFFAGVYVVAGLALIWLGADLLIWTLSVCLGFLLVAPFLAVGLYEVSRRLERGAPLSFPAVLGVIWRERTRQVPWAGAVLLLFFLFYTFFAHMLMAFFVGPAMLHGPPDDLATYLTGPGLMMIAAEAAFAGLCGFIAFGMMAISLPMLLDRDVDVVTAILTSVRTVQKNRLVMAAWAVLIAVLTLAALVPWLLGLFVVLPVLGHASWHLYRRAISPD